MGDVAQMMSASRGSTEERTSYVDNAGVEAAVAPSSSFVRNAIAGACLILASCAYAESTLAQDFYKDKRLTIVVGSPPGASYDLYGRLLAEHLRKFIPGNPITIVENRGGAGSKIAMNYLFRQAPQDGTVIGMAVNLIPFEQFVFPDSTRQYDVARFQWIGSMASLNGMISVWHTTPTKTLAGAMQSPVVLGAVSRSSETYIVPAILNEVMGTKFKIAGGYSTVNELSLAMERGEIEGHGGAWSNFRVNQPDWIKEKKVIPLIQVGRKKDRTMPVEVPLLDPLAKNDEQKAVYGLLSSTTYFARPFAMGPQVPADRVAIIRKAFWELMNDPEFIKQAGRRNFDISPVSGEEMAEAIDQLKESVLPAYAARIRKALQP
jgi:tripartite-type tricarboxylate transporter receptor subunit TctC